MYKALTTSPRRARDFDTKQEALDWLRRNATDGRILERRDHGEWWLVAVLRAGFVEEVQEVAAC